jgi:glycosyltransferase involved in cell wall biosynthesis
LSHAVDRPLLSVIILTLNEEANLPLALASLEGLGAEVFVVDSGSTDRTLEIARAAGCEIVRHPFENYALQRNWAFDHLPIAAPWTLCLDADERLTPELVGEIGEAVSRSDRPFDGYMLRKRTIFMGRWIRHGGQYPAWHLRLFRSGRGRCEARLYDQHFVVDGRIGRLQNDYVDVLASDLGTFVLRHNRWAALEAEELLARPAAAARAGPAVAPLLTGTAIERRRFLRARVYQRFPLFVRPFLFWFYGYVLRLGFLDGIEGLVFHTLQRFWFRFLVDAKIWERRRTGSQLPEPRLLKAPEAYRRREPVPGSGSRSAGNAPRISTPHPGQSRPGASTPVALSRVPRQPPS